RGPAPLYALERGLEVRRTEEGAFLLSERPLMVTRLNARAAELLARLAGERTAGELAARSGLPLADVVAFLDGLAGRRIVRRVSRTPPVRWPSVTVVVPARDRHPETRACVESLLAQDYPPHLLEVVVADDASKPPLAKTLSDLPVRVLRLERNAGQSAARNLAAETARGEILAFTDNDCAAAPHWLRALVAPLCEPGTGIVGGRALSPPPDGPVAAFEAVRSPLDMGAAPGNVGPEEHVAYLPSCNLAVDRETLRLLGGFDESLALGEDADLVWRALRAGCGVRYEPGAGVVHRHRTSLLAFLRRRADYGSSEADLQRRHPQTRRKMVVPVAGAAVLATPAALPAARWAGACLLALATLALCAEVGIKRRRLRRAGLRLPARRVAAAVLRQHGAGIYHLGSNVARYYGVALLGASLLWPPLLPSAFLLLGVPPVVDHRRLRPDLPLARFVLLYWSELAAYQAGVWRGCVSRRTLRPLLPKLRPVG
ncbi:MAG: mycofactocin biosynthesis glycosyltransferase MftF, partial [Actinomycetota bacterium]